MSNKMEVKPLLGKHYLSNQHTLILTNNNPYNSYDNELEGNVIIVFNKYPHLDQNKIRNLLEELQNNLELAVKVLEEEELTCNRIIEQKKVEIKKYKKLSQEQENRIFKQSFLKLYKKYIKIGKEKDELNKKVEAISIENQRLKMNNKLLLEREYSGSQIYNNTDIC